MIQDVESWHGHWKQVADTAAGAAHSMRRQLWGALGSVCPFCSGTTETHHYPGGSSPWFGSLQWPDSTLTSLGRWGCGGWRSGSMASATSWALWILVGAASTRLETSMVHEQVCRHLWTELCLRLCRILRDWRGLLRSCFSIFMVGDRCPHFQFGLGSSITTVIPYWSYLEGC